ncbi:hypothetical protein [Cystobacter ferrugineus]|uniref:Uncharacterized protein n=1 Tax=Cystobacter ferrugineus TaxID=83449 RepID=A0A1L9B1L0_9BACT|nr:hypothetical protein [Cystobacter ferrugineus]OJH36149.1 hypothetical protein BON30_33830 [Cystobacter ferrugineus]
MPPRHSSRPLLVGVGLLAFIPVTLAALGLAAGWPAIPPLDSLAPTALGVLAGVLSGGGFLLGYALGWTLRPPLPPPPPTLPIPVRVDLSRLSTEQLYLELERMNREALLAGPTRRVLAPWPGAESEK